MVSNVDKKVMYGNMTLEVSCSESWDGGVGGGGGGYNVLYGDVLPQGPTPLPFCICIIFYSKGYTFHLPSQEQCIPFPNPGSEVNEQHYGRT